MTANSNKGGNFMKPLKRKFVHKGKSAKTFKRHVRQTKGVNVTAPMRGGIRM